MNAQDFMPEEQIRRLLGTGMDQDTAITIISTCGNRDMSEFATKTDLRETTLLLQKDMADFRTELKTDMSELRTELKTDMSELRTELKTDMSGLRTELKTEMSDLRMQMYRLTLGLALVVIGTGLFT